MRRLGDGLSFRRKPESSLNQFLDSGFHRGNGNWSAGMTALISVLFFACLFLTVSSAFAEFTVEVHDPRTGQSLGKAHPSTIIVQFDESATKAARMAIHSAVGTTEYRELGRPGLVEIHLPPGMTPDAAMKQYGSLPSVKGVYPNHIYHLFKTPNDPLVPNQYALTQIDAFHGWEYEVGDSSPATIAVMDTGVDKTHPEFQPTSGVNLKYDYAHSQAFCPAPIPGCLDNTCNADPGVDALGHATEVAGIATAIGNNGAGISGVSWSSKIVSVKVFNNGGCSDDATLTTAVNYTSTLTSLTGRRTVVNMSLGECPDTTNASSCGACNGALTTAVTTAMNGGTIMVAASGNQDSQNNPFKNVTCPASIPGVIAVGATDSSQNIAYFSGQGPEMTARGIVAPGVNILTTQVGGSYGSNGVVGTSFASPHVAGLVGLLLSKNPALTQAQIMANLRGSAENIGFPSIQQGAGRVNAFLALRLLVNGTLANYDGLQKAIAFPNPFHPSTEGTATISIPTNIAGSNINVKIYTMDGRLVRALPGQTWDGKNDQGAPVASGTYMFEITTNSGKTMGKLALIR